MKAVTAVLIVGALVLTGCDRIIVPDRIPPVAPSGLRTSTGDNFIEILWNPSPGYDVAGYNVFVSSSYDGRYELIGSTSTTYFMDAGARNGNTYYYAVTAFDYDGNESELSRDVAYDVPRPEGYDVMLYDYRKTPNSSGYDFNQYTVLPYNAQNADMYYEYYNGEYYMDVYTDSDIQDMGHTNSLLDVKVAPSSGWSSTHDVRLFAGHTYVVWTHDDHYAKFRVTNVSPGRIVFDWAYQLQQSNPMLKRPPEKGGTRQGQPPNNRP